ncbi:hypothetical protein [Mesorhizobium sp.]|uniref:DUF7666 domain-containing protein n=1 Tax=Mesorhizobium sp. TaxID=1871066 RepID=UPI000FE7B3FA|nr:hypothetical protein [Mesorhizobium sp.]RWG33993.1 MAG: hypothetical protein EOQ60_10255 [Mesorhizobium sp.]TIS17642.1 MAG: hypothetical protein E5X10_02765 [Mesorhizobium sp.]
MSEIAAWHFTGKTLRDGRPIPADGEWLIHDGPEVVMCETGLHASRRIIDALQYAPGPTVCRVTCRRIVDENKNDKLVCWERRIDWRIENSDELLRSFARKAALSVIHLWDAPAIVKQYLETGDESIRDAAWAAARDAAWAAARDAARDAAWAAAWDAAWAAAWAAARDAAWAAARAAAWAAAWAAKLSEFNILLEQMLMDEHERLRSLSA